MIWRETNYFELAGGLSYREFELLRVKYSKCMKDIPGKLLILVRVSKGSNYMYQESTEGPSCMESFFATKFFQRYLIVGSLLNSILKVCQNPLGEAWKKLAIKIFNFHHRKPNFRKITNSDKSVITEFFNKNLVYNVANVFWVVLFLKMPSKCV